MMMSVCYVTVLMKMLIVMLLVSVIKVGHNKVYTKFMFIENCVLSVVSIQ